MFLFLEFNCLQFLLRWFWTLSILVFIHLFSSVISWWFWQKQTLGTMISSVFLQFLIGWYLEWPMGTFQRALIVADHLLLSLDPVPRCLDAKLLFNSCCCCKMLSSGWWPFEERGSPALWAEPLRTVLRSWALLLRSLRNWCLNVARASGEKWDSWEDWLFPY